ncbi:hypothetical protein TPB0596_04700 [Tsukamurella pulmonis]|uniref:hypothetical protein n=1 Tax=Tsukamurella pulmonis TaxID=47312 RepID=UPI001EDEA4C4|nr:hypothetical protein [Tsukamurella pulmonis]BDD80707.1 hypothetical protein TPB0596_04700 [Tsukamurella pulmonis]
MNRNHAIVAAGLAAVTVALTGCTSTGTAPVSAPSSGASSAATVGETIPGVDGVPIPTPAITAPTLASATGMDRSAAEAALAAGRPFLVALPSGAEPACRAALLVPGDARPWILNRSAAPARGAVLERDLAQVGCSGRTTPGGSKVEAAVDAAAAVTRALEANAPVIYAVSSGAVSACNTAVVLPSGQTWFLNRSGEASTIGDALSPVQNLYGCRVDPSR